MTSSSFLGENKACPSAKAVLVIGFFFPAAVAYPFQSEKLAMELVLPCLLNY